MITTARLFGTKSHHTFPCRKNVLRAFLAVMVLLSAGCIANAKHPGNESDYLSIVPPDWALLPENPDTHEHRFVSPSGDAWLALYARPPTEDIEAHLEGVRNHEDERITYERRGRAWIVVSGYKGDRIFYRKAILACGGRSWHHLAFEYPSDQKLAFDQFVTRASYALQIYNQVGCPR
jgi:hypothetical protein